MGALNILTQWWYWDVSSPVDSEDVVQRMMSCIAITGTDYEGCMELDCNDVLACITNPETGIMQAIIDSVSLQTSEQYRENGQSQSGLILGSGVNPACDLDILWGGIRSVIDLANDNNIDVLQVLEVVTNPYEFVQEVILGIFGVELPVIQSIVDWVAWVQDNILENYEAEITTAYLNEVMCDLFCLTRDSCQLTPETLTNYFYTRLGSSLTIGSLLDETITFLIGGVWVGTQIADVFFLSQFAFRAQLGKWFRLIGFLSVDTDFRIGANTPDNDWAILCTDCPDETLVVVTFDDLSNEYFSLSFVNDSTWTYTNAYVAQSTEQGNPTPSFKCAYGSPPSSSNEGFRTTVLITLPEVVDIAEASFEYYFNRAGSQNVVARSIVLLNDIGGTIATQSDSGDNGIRTTWTQFGSLSGSNVAFIEVTMSLNINGTLANPANTYAFIDNIKWTQS